MAVHVNPGEVPLVVGKRFLETTKKFVHPDSTNFVWPSFYGIPKIIEARTAGTPSVTR